jgi:hypothetical protein
MGAWWRTGEVATLDSYGQVLGLGWLTVSSVHFCVILME